jgi:predicted negative regulator of RcsB-dependent stress response
MVDEFSSDLEQEEALRNWWRDNWRWVVSGVVLGLAALAGWQYWQQQIRLREEAAAQAYSDFSAALTSGDKDKTDRLIKDLDSKYAASPYADPAHLALAQRDVAAGKFEQAATELKAVIDKSKDAALVQVARVRLARVQLQLGHQDEALALLDVSKAGAFAAQVHEVRGDVLLAKGDRSGARMAYQSALAEGMGKDTAPGETELLRLKLQDLSDAEVAAALPAPAIAPSPAK